MVQYTLRADGIHHARRRYTPCAQTVQTKHISSQDVPDLITLVSGQLNRSATMSDFVFTLVATVGIYALLALVYWVLMMVGFFRR